jgi:hypothetical protein
MSNTAVHKVLLRGEVTAQNLIHKHVEDSSVRQTTRNQQAVLSSGDRCPSHPFTSGGFEVRTPRRVDISHAAQRELQSALGNVLVGTHGCSDSRQNGVTMRYKIDSSRISVLFTSQFFGALFRLC